MDYKVLVPLAQGTEEMEAVVIIDLLRRAGFYVKTAGEHEIITCSKGVKILPDIILGSVDPDETWDAVILPGGAQGVDNFINNEHLAQILIKHNEKGRIIGAICAAPLVLSHLKILNNHSIITSHPSVMDQLKQYNYLDELVVMDKNIITSRGAGTSIEFALYFIRKFAGDDVAEKVASQILYIYF